MKSLFTLLLLMCSTFLFSQTHVLTLPNDVVKEVDVIKKGKTQVVVLIYPEKRERTIRRSTIVSLVDKMNVPNLNYNDDGRVFFTEVVDVENKTKNELFTTAKIWMVDTYNSAESVIEVEDKASGLIIGKGIATIMGSIPYDIKYTIKLQFKDGKYKANITNINTNRPLNKFATGGEQQGIYGFIYKIEDAVSYNNVNSSKKIIRNNAVKLRNSLVPYFEKHLESLDIAMKKGGIDNDW